MKPNSILLAVAIFAIITVGTLDACLEKAPPKIIKTSTIEQSTVGYFQGKEGKMFQIVLSKDVESKEEWIDTIPAKKENMWPHPTED